MLEEGLQQTALQELHLAKPEEAERQARFTALVERESRFVFRVAYAVLRNPADAEDVVQGTFLKLYRSNSWETMANEKLSWRALPGGWLSTSCRRREARRRSWSWCQTVQVRRLRR